MSFQKTYLFYFGHPAQFLFAKNTIKKLKQDDEKVILLIKSKDVLEDLLQKEGLEYQNIHSSQRGNSKFSIGLSLLKRIYKIFLIILRNRPNIMISTDASTAILGKLLGIKNITITEDDYELIKPLAELSYPYTNAILCPSVTNVGPYEHKKMGYNGYMKLAYLHPKQFTPQKDVIEKYNMDKPFILIRLARLAAFHDKGIEGMSYDLVKDIIEIANKNNYKVYMSIEGEIPDIFKDYILKINSNDMHSVLENASLLISDSQSMSVEAAMLGVPSIRYSSFAGKISVLEELEHQYELTKGINIDPELLLQEVQNFFQNIDGNDLQTKRDKMLNDKINVTDFLYWFLKNYPNSHENFNSNPELLNQFKND